MSKIVIPFHTYSDEEMAELNKICRRIFGAYRRAEAPDQRDQEVLAAFARRDPNYKFLARHLNRTDER